VVALMRQTGAVIGGEGNGGVILPALHAGRDAMAGAALVLGSMAASGRSLSELAAALPSYHMEKRRLDTGRPLPVEALRAALEGRLSGELDFQDGIRSNRPEGWVHVRPSNTEAIVRIIGESADPAWLQAALDEVERQVREHLP